MCIQISINVFNMDDECVIFSLKHITLKCFAHITYQVLELMNLQITNFAANTTVAIIIRLVKKIY